MKKVRRVEAEMDCPHGFTSWAYCGQCCASLAYEVAPLRREVTALKRENARLKRVAKAATKVVEERGFSAPPDCRMWPTEAEMIDALTALSRGGRKGRG